MDFTDSLNNLLESILSLREGGPDRPNRTREELNFAAKFCELFPEKKNEWQQLILEAAELFRNSATADAATITQAENILLPIGEAAKSYVIHCIGHSHIDMDWTWPWLETVTVCADTFTTVNKLMALFPDFTFCQSQAIAYEAMEEYHPEIFDMIKQRIAEGRWEVTASLWVEGDKNMASGEALCRQLLYAKRYLKERLGLSYDTVKIAWEPDTFGHPWTLPAILRHGGVSRYHYLRAGQGRWLSRWRSPDGSEVLNFQGQGCYGRLAPDVLIQLLLNYIQDTGLGDFLLVFGVGDHGGGPTKQDLTLIKEMDSWPIFPTLRFSTTEDYFRAVESHQDAIKPFVGELNPTFEGCYTSQSKVKRVNRAAENLLPEAEIWAAIAGVVTDLPYPRDDFRRAWQHLLFNQFHDILAGSSGHAAMEEAEARFRQAEAIAGSIKARALRRLAANIDTSKFTSPPKVSLGQSIGAGAGDLRVPGRLSTVSTGMTEGEVLTVFNSLPFARSELVAVKIWDREWPEDQIIVKDGSGRDVRAQIVGTSSISGGFHHSLDIVFPAIEIPGTGYRTYFVTQGQTLEQAGSVHMPSPLVIENEFLRVEIDDSSGAIKHLIDRQTGFDYVPEGQLAGLFEYSMEAPHKMTAWEIGPIVQQKLLNQGGIRVPDESHYLTEGDCLGMVSSMSKPQTGPLRAAVRTLHEVDDSWLMLEIALSARSKIVEVSVTADWRELGSPKRGVPMLRIAFPARLAEPKARFEIPFGSIERPVNGKEVVGLRWVDLSGVLDGTDRTGGITLLNDSKYGFSADGNTLRTTLLRSSYDPDPFPEMGIHRIRLALLPSDGSFSVAAAMRAAAAFNQPMGAVTADLHEGTLPLSNGYVEVLSPNVMLACLKKGEDAEVVILRFYETEGKQTNAKIRLTGIDGLASYAREVDLMEQPLPTSSARLDGEILTVTMKPHSIVTVEIA